MRAICLALLICCAPLIAGAQQLATLVADRVSVERGDQLVATGRVEVFYDGVRLRASRIRYDQPSDRLFIEGPITLDDGDAILVLADAAELDADLENGILQSARMVLDQQLQLAATQLARVGGRYTQLDNTVASSCEICANNPTPTWEIRARRVIHDEQERQLYFENATFRVLGLPIAYFPRLRLPDSTRDRATGLLIPRVRTTSQLGTGIKLPYFIAIGRRADLTLTPYLSGSTTTLEGRYRQVFRNGRVQFDGAFTNDDLLPDVSRYYLFGRGAFDLPRDFKLEFDLELLSDEAYLIDYGYSDQDRLETGVRVFRARDKDLFNASLVGFDTLRDAEFAIEEQLPRYYGTVDYERRVPLGAGELVFGANLAALARESSADQDGRDTSRVGLSAEYRRGWILPSGLVGDARAGVSGDLFFTKDDSRFDDITERVSPHVEATLRLPMQRSGAGGVRHLLEPVVQLAWSDVSGSAVPNEDSILVEFDEGNLFALSRFPGRDRIETGLRANLGLRYTRTDPSGWTLGAVGGRVLRDDALNDIDPDEPVFGGFTGSSGLSGRRSDWLAAAQLRLGDRFSITARALFDDQLVITKNEARMGYTGDRLTLDATYVFLNGEPFENRPRDTHELTLDSSLRLSRHWIGKFNTRYDFDQDEAQSTGLGLEYRSECITVDLSVSRRFTESARVDPSTEFGFGVSLVGFGGGQRDASYRKTCKG
ncbi:LPS-assembly protein LptD [Maribius pontilimi]|uniref:LPS-assembly protein LptD n=1 Tax=Palleronia pontilimi TaxID=1964209 RepID=A0A934IEJ7_9RHOB|nr:LPS assembly protein LptD [Palleronia pontilimi]MBJ3761712.1 LPS-assembly protein LptD [Palleronia pontilimi]